MNFRIPLIAASALLALSATSPVFAQSSGSGGGGGSNSMTTICSTRMEQQKLLVPSIADPTKRAEAMKEMDMAQAASTSGDATACGTHLNKVEALAK
jgi:hypothetical protein